MTDESNGYEGQASQGQLPFPAGAQLRAAREARGLSLGQIAAETRISERHLAHLEAGEFDALPGRTYAVGFARNFAKAVGLDQGEIAALVRAELGDSGDAGRQSANFQPGDPARAPGRGLVWFSLFAALLLLAGLFVFAREIILPSADLPSLVDQQQAEEAAAAAERQAEARRAAEPVDAGGAVVFTASDAVWVRFYTADGVRLKEGEMAAGESFTIPATAQAPQLITGRPDLLTITIGGRPVPRISDAVETVSDVPVDARALLARPARPAAGATPPPAASATPSATAATAN